MTVKQAEKVVNNLIVPLAAIVGTIAGIAFGFMGLLALLKHFKWKTWLAIITAAILSLPIGIVVGGAAGALVIFYMYPDFDWKF